MIVLNGLMHLAAVTGTPQIALFGSTSISKNTPLSNSGIVINGNKNSIENITVNDVTEEFEKLLHNF